MYETNHAAVAKHITDYTIELQNKNLADAKTMFNELVWYMIANTNAQKYSYDGSTMTMGDTVTQIPFVPSLLQTEDAE